MQSIIKIIEQTLGTPVVFVLNVIYFVHNQSKPRKKEGCCRL